MTRLEPETRRRWSGARGAAYWRLVLKEVPDWALRDEVAWRDEIAPIDRVVALPGLVVDPVGNTVTWRGDDYVLGGRGMEVILALALARREGRIRVRADVLAELVWRGWETEQALANLRSYVCGLRARFPGLVASRRGLGRVAYELALADAPAAAADVA